MILDKYWFEGKNTQLEDNKINLNVQYSNFSI